MAEAATAAATVGHTEGVEDTEAAHTMTLPSMEPRREAAMAQEADTMTAVDTPEGAGAVATIRIGREEWSSSRGGPATVFDTNSTLREDGMYSQFYCKCTFLFHCVEGRSSRVDGWLKSVLSSASHLASVFTSWILFTLC